MRILGRLIEIGDDVVIESADGKEITIRGLTHEQVRSVATSYQLNVVLQVDSAEASA